MRDVARFATVELHVKEESKVLRLPQLLFDLGLHRQTQECFWVLSYDATLNVRSVTEVARGSYAHVQIHLPAVYSAVLTAGADRFMVAHNHPNDANEPTAKDISLTASIMKGANALGLYFEDHLIVTPKKGMFSFQQSKLLFPADYAAQQEASSK